MLYPLAETFAFDWHFDGLAATIVVLLICIILSVLVGVALSPVIIVAALARRRANHWLNQRIDTVIAQFTPPHNFSPAEVGLLYDMRCDKTEVIATLFHLELRGIISIIDSTHVTIIDQTAYTGLPEYEKIAIRIARGETEGLDSERHFPIVIYDVNSGQKHQLSIPLPQPKTLRSFSSAVQQSIVDKGIPMRNFTVAFIKKSIIVAGIIALLPLLSAALPGVYDGNAYGSWSLVAFINAFTLFVVLTLFAWPLYAALALFFTWLWTRLAGRYWINTPQARALWPELEGYKLYLEQVDVDAIRFESTDHSGRPVTTTLPYAMALGLETRWRSRLV